MNTAMKALRRPAAAGVLVGLVIVVAWWQLLWNPQSSALAQAQSAQQAASTGLIGAGQTLGHLKHLEQISPQLVALEQRLSAAVPTGPSLDTFLISVNQMAESAGVDLQTVAPTPPPTTAHTTTPTTAPP
jgi:Tfp pilus assembly protein PilO